jgi:hypothetical protein
MGSRGFTLLEIFIALIIAATMLTTVFGAIWRTMSSKDHAERQADLFSVGREAVLRIADDVEAALHPRAAERFLLIGTPGSGQPPADSIQFIAMNRGRYGPNQLRPGAVYIAYGLEPVANQYGTYALWRYEALLSALLGEEDDSGGAVEEVAESVFGDADPASAGRTEASSYLLGCWETNQPVRIPGSCVRVAGLQFYYYDNAGERYEQWDTTEGATEQMLPAAVEITLTLLDESGRLQEFSTIADVPLARGQPTPRIGRAPQPDPEEGGQEDGEDD